MVANRFLVQGDALDASGYPRDFGLDLAVLVEREVGYRFERTIGLTEVVVVSVVFVLRPSCTDDEDTVFLPADEFLVVDEPHQFPQQERLALGRYVHARLGTSDVAFEH